MAERSAAPSQIKLAVFMHGNSNYHIAGWRHPDAYADSAENLSRWAEFARTMERGKMDMLFIADSVGIYGVGKPDLLSHRDAVEKFEPLTALAALSALTKNIGLVATLHTTYSDPYTAARLFASLDHLSGGRAGWNFVTGGNREGALNYSRDTHMEHGERYDRAEEFADVVLGLWDSFEDGAFPRDKASGRYLDPNKMHLLDHKGPHFSVRGPLSSARSPQGRPVIVQAGSSEPGKQLTARIADVMFTAQASFEQAQAFYADVKGRLATFGRSPDSLKIMPGVSVYVGRTAEEAEEKFQKLNELIPMEVALASFSEMLGGIDLSSYPLDGPMPELQGNSARMSAPPAYVKLARRENLTLGQVARRAVAAKQHCLVRGTARQVADELEHWFVGKAADGFNLLPAWLPGSLNDFVDRVIPELQRRGLYRTEYEGRTLRANLGLPIPQNAHTRANRAKQADMAEQAG
jgi:FMN-dependent oxidoreductase (nitrilotriacetate monooxygenase family)